MTTHEKKMDELAQKVSENFAKAINELELFNGIDILDYISEDQEDEFWNNFYNFMPKVNKNIVNIFEGLFNHKLNENIQK